MGEMGRGGTINPIPVSPPWLKAEVLNYFVLLDKFPNLYISSELNSNNDILKDPIK